MNRVAQYRSHARNSRELAERVSSEEERALLRKLAHHWEALADIHERLEAARTKPP